jgi:cystathionine beta-lyase/cystathionine gamma-synthase
VVTWRFVKRETILRERAIVHVSGCESVVCALLTNCVWGTESLGDVESLIEHPAIMTHASIPAAQRAALGISDSMVRLSIGLEDVDDLVVDLRSALACMKL